MRKNDELLLKGKNQVNRAWALRQAKKAGINLETIKQLLEAGVLAGGVEGKATEQMGTGLLIRQYARLTECVEECDEIMANIKPGKDDADYRLAVLRTRLDYLKHLTEVGNKLRDAGMEFTQLGIDTGPRPTAFAPRQPIGPSSAVQINIGGKGKTDVNRD